jgi:hypothetical protein
MMDRVVAAVERALAGQIRRVRATSINPFVLLVAQVKVDLRLAGRGLRLINDGSTGGALKLSGSRALTNLCM